MYEKEEIISDYIKEELSDVPNILDNELTLEGRSFEHRKEFEFIKHHIDEFLEKTTNNRYFALPGLRGVGKTTLLYQTYEYLFKSKNINPNQILFISCENLNDIMDFKIIDVVKQFLETYHNTTLRRLDKKIFLLIDESQYDKNWALSGKRIYDRTKNIFMVFTGSSALNLEYDADSARRLLKENITPLNYNQHLKLKYNYNAANASASLKKLIFQGDITDAVACEQQINQDLININGYSTTDWDEFLKYGGFPTSLFETNHYIICKNITGMIKKVISHDMGAISSITTASQTHANRLLRFLALQKPGDISQEKMGTYLGTSKGNVRNILDILEKTQLIFHCEPHIASPKRSIKSWEYFFATSSIKHILTSSIGNLHSNKKAYLGVLLENLVASTLFYLSNEEGNYFTLYYDPEDKTNVDFVIQGEFQKAIPIEVSIGKKKKRQIAQAIERYNADYGIIISNTTKTIAKKDNIIYLPPKTFSFL